MVGRIGDRELLEAYYASSQMLVIPFKGQGGYILTLAALESMAVGRPVIIGYETDDTLGVIRSSSNPHILAERIMEILFLNDGEYASLARGARSFAEKSSSAEVASQVENAYFRLVGQPRRLAPSQLYRR